MVMTEEGTGISRWWFARWGGGSLILNSQFSILNYWRGGTAGEIRNSEFGIRNYRRGGTAGVFGAWCPRLEPGDRDLKCRGGARRSQWWWFPGR